MKTRYLKINPLDNVAVAITCLKAGETIQGDEGELIVKEDIPAGHKVTLKEFSQGENVIKYGYPIGHTIEPMEAGCWISDKQIKTNLEGLLEYTYHLKTDALRGIGARMAMLVFAMKYGLSLLLVVSMALPTNWRKTFERKLTDKEWMLSRLSLITMVVHNWEMTMRIPRRYSAIW